MELIEKLIDHRGRKLVMGCLVIEGTAVNAEALEAENADVLDQMTP